MNISKPGGRFGFRGKGRRRPDFHLLNEQIRARTLQVIDHNGDNLGNISKDEALRIAKDAGLDLFIVTEKADIPIAKILDYGKYKFEKNKKEKGTKKKKSGSDYKEIKMRYNIDIGDYNTKLNHSIKFIEKGKKIKLNITLRGREIQHGNLAVEMAKRFLDDVCEIGHTDTPDRIRLTGRSVILFIHPGPDKERVRIKKEKEEKDAEDNPELEDS